MGAPVDTGLENFEEAILKLPIAERTKLAHWILESVVEEAELPVEVGKTEVETAPDSNSVWPPTDLKVADSERLSSKKPWYADIPRPQDLSEEEWKAKVHEVAGSWADHPMTAEELIEDIYSSRTISTREINLDD